MGLLIVIIAGAIGWGLWSGKLGRKQLPPLLLGVAGAFLAARGNFLIGAATMALAVLWYRGLTARLFGAKSDPSDQYAIDQARFLLGVSRFDNADHIRERHRMLIAKDHPDTGGNAERAAELNKARDLLLRELAQRDK